MKKIYMKQQVTLLDKETLGDFSRNTIVHILNLFYEVLTNAMDIKKRNERVTYWTVKWQYHYLQYYCTSK